MVRLMDNMRQEFRTNKRAQAKVRRVIVVLLVVSMAITYWLWPAPVRFSGFTFLRMSGAGFILVATLLFIRMLLTE